MTGISDVARSVRGVRRTLLVTLAPLLARCAALLPPGARAPLLRGLQRLSVHDAPSMPLPQLWYMEERAESSNCFFDESTSDDVDAAATPAGTPPVWALLLPVCCRVKDGGEACMSQLRAFVESLEQTTTADERATGLRILVGVDQHDIFFDCHDTQCRVRALFQGVGVPSAAVSFEVLRAHLRGRLCRIWDVLACRAKGCDYFLLVGDDIRFLTAGWKAEIEAQFASIAAKRILPVGCACVAFRDTSFPVFPTFPVVHRRHLAAFHGCLLPAQFVNQHGDPFLFELYRRLGAAEFTVRASLDNTVGGAQEARYAKQGVDWHGDILTRAVTTLVSSLGERSAPMFRCINVVVPTFRCEVELLQRMASLASELPYVSVDILLVVDNPCTPHMSALLALQDWTPNHVVRVMKNERNLGASGARNAGIAQCHGDWTVLLDDDVIPDQHLIDAYLGAIARSPGAQIIVGVTELPPPVTLMQHALVASQMTFFYNVARRMKHPPWGVTANLCIRGRERDAVWFNESYPKTGGGEDVEFCLRVKDLQQPLRRDEAVVAAPEARVVHPFWRCITKQVLGWALGDVRCLSALPTRSFYGPPNWAEFILFYWACGIAQCALHARCGGACEAWRLVTVAAAAVTCEVVLSALTAMPHTPAAMRSHARVCIALCAAWPGLVQDTARLASKLLGLRLTQICLQFDWMDGQRQHVSEKRGAQLGKCVMFALAAHLAQARLDAAGAPLCAMALMLCIALWGLALQFSPEREVAQLASMLPPLPMTLPAGGARPFVILAYQRTGSNLLCGRLHNHSHVVMHNELFNVAKIWTYQNEDVRADPTWQWDLFSRDADPCGFLADVFTRTSLTKPHAGAVGFKLFPDHWTSSNQAALRQLLADPRVVKIILRRQNVLRVYVSKLRADKTGMYLSRPLDGVPVHVEPAALAEFAEHYSQVYQFYDDCVAGQPVHRVSYDALASPATADGVVWGVLRHLGVHCDKLPPPLACTVRQSTAPLRQGVTNYDQLREAFKHHPLLRRCFDEEETGGEEPF